MSAHFFSPARMASMSMSCTATPHSKKAMRNRFRIGWPRYLGCHFCSGSMRMTS